MQNQGTVAAAALHFAKSLPGNQQGGSASGSERATIRKRFDAKRKSLENRWAKLSQLRYRRLRVFAEEARPGVRI
jgi:hypothetical protein